MVKKLERQWVPTPFGPFCLEGSTQGVYRVIFPRPSFRSKIAKKTVLRGELTRAARLIQAYLKGKKVSFKGLRLDFTGLSFFERKVLALLVKVRSGQSISYRNLAIRAGSRRAARAVGNVMKKNRLPIILPCHRVVRSDGGLGDYSQGLAWKKRLLQLEKIR